MYREKNIPKYIHVCMKLLDGQNTLSVVVKAKQLKCNVKGFRSPFRGFYLKVRSSHT